MSLKLPVIRDHHAVYILGHLVHHWVRPPGGLADKQSLALLFGVAVTSLDKKVVVPVDLVAAMLPWSLPWL